MPCSLQKERNQPCHNEELPVLQHPLLSCQDKSASQSKNVVCALQINCKLLPFPSKKKNPADMSRRSILFHTKGSFYNQTCLNIIFEHGSELNLNCTFNGSNCYVLYKCTYWAFILYDRNVSKKKKKKTVNLNLRTTRYFAIYFYRHNRSFQIAIGIFRRSPEI